MKITANGKDTLLEKEVSVSELLTLLKVETPEYVTVLINEDIINREDFDTHFVKEGDIIEFLYFMGGGAL